MCESVQGKILIMRQSQLSINEIEFNSYFEHNFHARVGQINFEEASRAPEGQLGSIANLDGRRGGSTRDPSSQKVPVMGDPWTGSQGNRVGSDSVLSVCVFFSVCVFACPSSWCA